MSGFVGKERVLDALNNLRTYFDPVYDHAVGCCILAVQELPEEEAPEYEWEYRFVLDEDGRQNFMSRRWYCQKCGNWQTYGETRYCPECGARMKKKV